ncbi:DUF3726 domain-containing protein [Amylibacter sp.]|nr:DUF3726 domain-containing protein [Amylibacter sp.]
MLTESEITAYAKKATRGAGFSWGMAEEAAMATLKLYRLGYDGFKELIPILKNADGEKQPLDTSILVPCGLTLGTFYADSKKNAGNREVIGHYIFQSLCGNLSIRKPKFPNDAPEIIKQFAHRTYVPDSEESRLRGAG